MYGSFMLPLSVHVFSKRPGEMVTIIGAGYWYGLLSHQY